MLKRTVALAFLNDVLWNMMIATNTSHRHNKDQALGIILDVEPLLVTDKIEAIKTLRNWIHSRTTIQLCPGQGKTMVDALLLTRKLSGKELVFEDENRFGLKEAKDFIDLMEAVLRSTEPKTF